MSSNKEEQAKQRILANADLITRQTKQSLFKYKIQQLKEKGKTITPELKAKIIEEIEEFARDFL